MGRGPKGAAARRDRQPPGFGPKSQKGGPQQPVAGGGNSTERVVLGQTVSMSEENEKLVLDLLGDVKIETKQSTATTSRRFKKVRQVLDKLLDEGFSFEAAEKALSATGGEDAAAVLDWLCLNLDEDELPRKYVSRKETKVDASQLETQAHGTLKHEEEGHESEGASCGGEAHTWDESDEKILASAKADTGEPPSAGTSQEEVGERRTERDLDGKDKNACAPVDTKAWIMQQYDEFESSEEELDELLLAGGRAPPKKKNYTDDDIPHLLDKLRQLKEAAFFAVGKKKREVNDDILSTRRILSELDPHSLKLFDKEEKDKKRKQKESDSKPDPVQAGDEAFGSLFDESNEDEGKYVNTIVKEGPRERPDQWSGKTPKQILQDWCQKNKCTKPKYAIVDKRANRCSVEFAQAKKSRTYIPEGSFSSIQDGHNVAATLALYSRNMHKPLYRMLPPVYRDMWLEWVKDAEYEKQKSETAKKEQVDAIVGRVLGLTLEEIAEITGTVVEQTETTTTVSPADDKAPAMEKADDEVKDSWDDSSDDDHAAPEKETRPDVAESWENLSSDGEGDSRCEAKAEDPKPSVRKNQSRRSDQRSRPLVDDEAANQKHRDEVIDRETSPHMENMRATRAALPVKQHEKKVIDTIRKYPVTVICGETGSGKSTQIPQFILDDADKSGRGSITRVVCTQPRRISAISLAERVAVERGERGVAGPDGQVGFHIRLESKMTENTRLLFCTTGILLRRLQLDPEDALSDVSHVIVDEVHERDLQSDFLLIVLKEMLSRRRKLKIVLMSATINAQLFSDYFKSAPIIEIPGRTYPVTVHYLESVLPMVRPGVDNAVLPENLDDEYIDYELAEDLLYHISTKEEPGAILVFLPGLLEIENLYDRLTSNRTFNRKHYSIVTLHSSLSATEQARVFERPPKGVRKIVIATNIAETSITIDDIVYVIDCGKEKINTYDNTKRMACLVEHWVSRASANQRAGRAGRVKAGVCYRLYTSCRYNEMMKPFRAPDILRAPLTELCLQILVLDLGNVYSFLSRALEPPSVKAIDSAMATLREVSAIDEKSSLTPLGYHLSALPVDVHIGKMMLFGAMFQCLEPVLIIAASMSYKSPFVSPIDKRAEADAAQAAFGTAKSDHLAMLKAYKGWQKHRALSTERAYCNQHFLSATTLKQIELLTSQFAQLLQSIGFVDKGRVVRDTQRYGKIIGVSDEMNKRADNVPLVKAVITAGLYPHVVRVEKAHNRFRYFCDKEEVFIHPRSVNAKTTMFESPWLVYHEKVRSTRIYIRDCSMISNYSLLLFGGAISVQHTENVLCVDSWMRMTAPAKTGVIFKHLRKEVDKLFQAKISDPHIDLLSVGRNLVNALVQLISTEGNSS